MSDGVVEQIRKIFNEINEKNHPIGKRSWLHEVENLKHRVLAVLADHVCIPKQNLQDYIDFVDGLRSHGKPKEVLIKYEIYKNLLGVVADEE